MAPLLVQLVQQPKIKTLMTDLFIILLRNKPFQDDALRLVSNLIHNFLHSEQCDRLFSNLILNQVLRNQETILPGIFKLLQDYLLNPGTKPMLEAQGANVLNHVLQLNAVATTVVDGLVKESQSALENPEMLKIAVNAAVSNLKK